MFSRILGVGHALPKDCISNQQLTQWVDTSDEWIRERTGIHQRYRISGDECTTSLAAAAAEQALSRSQYDAKDIDLIIVATTSPDQPFPSTACLVQAKLGNTRAIAFDIQAVCSGFVYALTIADQMIRGGQAKNALVIGAESMSRLLDWSDRGTCVLFGDGAGAVILEKSSQPGILGAKLYADGSYAPSLYASPLLHMDGRSVFRFAVQAMTQAFQTILKDLNLRPEDIDWLIPHQANQRILDAVGERSGLPSSRLISTVNQHANTSAASIPLAMNHAFENNQLEAGQRIALVSMGAGFTWGSLVFIWS